MKKVYIFIFLTGFSCSTIFAQSRATITHPVFTSLNIHPVHKQGPATQCAGIAKLNDFHGTDSKLIHFEKRHILPPAVQAEKDRKTLLKIQNRDAIPGDEPKSSLVVPKVGVNMEGNSFDGYTPPDNSIAISNNGFIVSVINSNLEYYNSSGTFIGSTSFKDFFNNPSFTGSIYDPVVIYDSQADRFFMVILHGTASGISKVIACFTVSNDPAEGWYCYPLTGNVLNNGCWFDYPKIGFSEGNVFVTGNLYKDAGDFSEVVCFQIDKSSGYTGQNMLDWQYWYQIDEAPFTLVPASNGQASGFTPGMYFISTMDNANTDKIKVYHLSGDYPATTDFQGAVMDADFSLAGDAMQKETDVVLNNNDSRGLHAFYLNGIIHFIFHSDFGGGYAGINYNRLDLKNNVLWTSSFGSNGFDYSYPSLASFGADENDKSVMISFLRSGATIYPESRVVYCDDDGNWSSSARVKEGETYVDVYATDNRTRWGDYSGISRKQNANTPEVWLSGCFGHYGLNEHSFNSWIAQVKSLDIGISEASVTPANARVIPNPVTDRARIEFEVSSNTLIDVTLTDINNKTVMTLFRDMAKTGKNIFTFNKGALKPGVYFVNIKSSSKTIAHEKIIID